MSQRPPSLWTFIFPALLKVGISKVDLVAPRIVMKMKIDGMDFFACDDKGFLGRVLPRGFFFLQHRNSRYFATAVGLPTLVHYAQKFIKIFPRALAFRLFFLSLPPRCWSHRLLDSRLAFACKLVGSVLLLLKTSPFHSLLHPYTKPPALVATSSAVMSFLCAPGTKNGYLNLP